MSSPRTLLFAPMALLALAALVAPVFPSVARAGDGVSPAVPAPPTPAAPAPRPKLVIDRTAHDFGAAKQHVELKAEFTVRNDGTATLHVSDVHGDCGCATGIISEGEIPAGRSAKLTCVFRTYTFVGPQTKSVRVVSDDPDAKDLSVRLTVDVAAGIVLEPANFFFGPVLVGASPTVPVVAKWREGTGKPFKILGVEAAGLPDAVFESKPFDAPPWHGYTVTLSFKKPPPSGTTFASARIRTDDPDAATIETRIAGTVSTKVFLSQRVVTVGLVAPGKGAVRTVVARGFDGTIDLGALTVSSKKGVVAASAARDPKEAGQWTIEIRLPEGAASGPVDDTVLVKTAVAGEEVSEIRVVGSVLPPTK